MNREVVIERRFCGPPDSGNGGYVCGVLAAHFDGPAEVTLWKPPPLETPMAVIGGEGGTVQLMHGDEVIAEAKAGQLDLLPPAPVSWDEASQAAINFIGFEKHPFPGCFVCGPQRAVGDGLRIFAGDSKKDSQVVAAPWQPHDNLAAENGHVDPAYLFAALDCPGYFAMTSEGEAALLGRMTADARRPVKAGEKCVVIAWLLGREGRKAYTGSAIYREDGTVAGLASAVWIRLRA